jgi:gluconokinase
MHAGIPLTDADRATWLQAIEAHTRTYTPSNPAERDLVVTCSALKHEYRDTLRAGSAGRADDSRVGFLFLDAPEEVLRARAGRREGHFAGAGLVRSQFAVLERPVGEEGVVVVGVDRPLAEVEKRALDAVRGLMGR